MSTTHLPIDRVSNDVISTTVDNVELATLPTTAANKDDAFLVAFDEPFDTENPKCWSAGKKWTVTDVLSATGFNRIMVSTIMAPALTIIAKDLHMNSVESAMALSAYLLATAFGPLVIGPLSEVYGRAPILHFSNILFLLCNFACGFANSKELLIACRFLGGFGASAIYSLAGGVLGDIWRPEQRGRTLSVYLLIPLLGAAVGPIIGGFIIGRATWRWIFWSTSAFQAVMTVMSYLCFQECYAPVILHRRALDKRKTTGDQRYYTLSERLNSERSVPVIIRRSLSRPLRLLAFHPIIQISAVMSGLTYGTLYIVLTTYSNMWIHRYHEKVEISGLHYITVALGEILGSQIGGPLMDYIFRKLKTRANGEIAPEYHLPIMLPAVALAPLGLIVYGWCAQYRTSWVLVDLGIFINMFCGQMSSQPLQAYIIDAYPDHASSATAASQFVRSLTAFSFPLFAPKLYSAWGYGWGNTTLAFFSLGLGIPGPLFLWFFGARLRGRAQSIY